MRQGYKKIDTLILIHIMSYQKVFPQIVILVYSADTPSPLQTKSVNKNENLLLMTSYCGLPREFSCGLYKKYDNNILSLHSKNIIIWKVN